MKQLEQLQKCYQVTHTHVKKKKTKTNKHQTCFYIKHLKAFKTKKEDDDVTRFAAGSVLIGEKCTERVSLCEHVS